MAKTILYSTLNTYNPEYCELDVKKLQILYEGGTKIEKNAQLFIHREAMEQSEASYNSRIKCISYRNYFAKIINDYVSDLFSKSFAVSPASDASDGNTPGEDIKLGEADKFWREFASNTDLQSHNISNVLSDVLTEALCSGRSYIGVDFPKIDIVPSSRKEEEELGTARAYTIKIPTLSVIDWEVDEFGKYKYLVLKNITFPRATFADKRDKRVTQFKIWQKEDGAVKFSTYEIITKIDKEPKKDDPCLLIEEGIVSFKEIPVLCLEVPTQLWIGGLIGNLCIEHLRRSSSLVHAMNKNLFSIPFYQQGPELPANGDLNSISQNTHRGNQTASQMRMKGFAVGSSEDKISFVEPEGHAYEIINQQLKELVDAIHAIVNQMAAAASATMAQQSAIGRSGLSKMMDNHSKELVLTAYAGLIKEFVIKLYDLVAAGRNENIIWSVQGMSDFKIVDRDQLLKEASTISLIRQIAPSKTWIKHNAFRMINELDQNLSTSEQKTIKDEIDEYFDSLKVEDLLPPKPEASGQMPNKKVKK